MNATQALGLLFLIAGSCGIAALARRLNLAAPILLVVAGLAVAGPGDQVVADRGQNR
jgi:hypothetical protein